MTKQQIPTSTHALDDYLRQSEAQYSDIIPNTEKHIVWAEPDKKQQTDVAIIYLHGFSATRQETRPLADIVANKLGANLFYTRLAGHGRPGDSLLEGDLKRWQEDALETWNIGMQLGKRVIIIGNSTGATLATWLSQQVDETSIAAMIMLSPNFRPRDPMARLLTWPFGGKIAELVVGKYRHWEPLNRSHARYWSYRYPSRTLVPMMKLVSEVEKIDKSKITVPIQIIYSPKDQVVSAPMVEKTFHQFGSQNKQLVPFVDSENERQHILAGDILSPNSTAPLAEIIVQFLYDNKIQ